MKTMKFFKTIALPFTIALSVIGLAGCGNGDYSNKSIAQSVATAAKTTIAGDSDLVTGQLSLMGRMTVDKNDKGDTVVVDVAWTSENAGQWTILPVTQDNVVYATPNFTEEEQNYKLIGTVNYKGAVAKAEITGKIVAKAVGGDTTKINQLVLDQFVAIEGTVFKAAKVTNGFYVMDDTGTVFVFNAGNTMVTTGTTVKVEGKYLLYAGSFQKIYQIDATVEDGSVTTTNTTVKDLPYSKATSSTVANAAALKPTAASTKGTVVATREDYHKFFVIEGYLILYVNSYGNPTIEIAENNNPSSPGKYLAFYPASSGVETLYADIFGAFTYNSSGIITPNSSKIGDGNKYKVYCVIYDHSLDSTTPANEKLRWLPVAVRAI